MNIEVSYLEMDDGTCPYLEWERQLDTTARGAVRIRINRIRLGNFGDCKSVTAMPNLFELRVHLGPGYRIYFGKIKEAIVIILCGGSKKSQTRDIKKAKEYWQIYKNSIKKK
jgi:putative addiction module killer protein